ncbi:MAG TPA: signal recognition particle subunit SRP19/SEC65 family protein [Candidatus Thermoplasmatota archaeon]|nr:signal recognition particle subunit SRP19/SEC65 family protein [Candidatus Thermoplasmatota archaeon]
MVSRDDGKLVLWPLYFDLNEPRPWRRVPKELAVNEPTAEAIARIAAELRLKPVLEKGVSHPKRWWKEEGRVLVDVRGAKSVLIQQIAERLKATRQPPAQKTQK